MLTKQQFSRFYGVEVITHEVSSLEFNIPIKSDGGLGCRQNDEAYMECFCSNWLNWGGLDKRKIC